MASSQERGSPSEGGGTGGAGEPQPSEQEARAAGVKRERVDDDHDDQTINTIVRMQKRGLRTSLIADVMNISEDEVVKIVYLTERKGEGDRHAEKRTPL